MKDKKYKTIILIVVIIFILILSLIGVYSFFGWQSKDSLVDVTVSSGTGSCTLLSDNNKALEPVSSKEEGRIIKFNGRQEMAPKGVISWNMTINNINNLKHNSFKYELVNETTGVSYKSGDFSTINNGSVIRFENSEKLSYNTNNTYTLYLWIDGTMDNNPLSMAGSNIDFDMNCEVTPPPPTLVEHITNLYNNAPKNNVTNNNITYHYAESVSLMNDRLGGTTQGLDDGNIRYYGATPNNYINFNNELWRIIGVFEGKVKIIRNESIGDMSWNSIDSDNNWDNITSLNNYLNNDYYNSLNEDKYKIIASSWATGETASPKKFPNEILNIENVRKTTNLFNFGLLLPSDYGYATDLGKCLNKKISMYNDSQCINNDWIYETNKNQWLLLPLNYINFVCYIDGTGKIGSRAVSQSYTVKPVAYLKPIVNIISGEGTLTSPYKIK